MKRTGLLLMLICSCVYLQAQKPKLNKEEFRARQEAFITQNAQLTPQEAQAFFPLYFELQDEKKQLNDKAWKLMRQGRKDNVSEEP